MQPDQNQPRGPYAPDAGAQANWPPNSVPGQGFGTVPPQGWPQEQQAWPQGQPYPPYTPEQLQQMQYEAYMQQMPEMPTAQQPQQEPPRKKRKKKKQGGGSGGAVWKTLIALVLIGGAAWYFLKDMLVDTRQSTAVIEMGTLGTSYTGDALIVRNETAYDEEGVQYIDYVAQEGSVVYRGDVVCYVYSTGYSSKEMTALQDCRDQIKDYQQTLLKSETNFDQKMIRLESDVVERGLEVRSLVQGARGNLINQERILKTAITQRQSYFRSKYSSDMRLNRLYDDESNQQRRIDSWINQTVATQESIVSFYTDGFEYALTPTEYEKYTPSQVRSMINGEKPQTSTAARGRTNLYRLVKQNNYAVLMLVRNTNWNPVEGTTYKLVLEQFSNTVVDAQVLSFTRSGGELLLRLAVIGDVRDVLYMRTCQAQLGEYVDCLQVPQGALYTQNNATGVVVTTEDNQVFIPVTVLRQEGGKAYISPIQTGVLTAGQTVRLFK
ncbi:MAG: hypothetical protein MR842_12935 [Clostridiales bacterium]|nr:hypothetical protein [Clostridiales bacterium]MDO4349540.1 HlyD family efflux transporter periplasmic adaptor subunit [Eubacteriales bacterium]